MKTLPLVIATVFLLFSVYGQEKKYGNEITLKEKILISNILSNPLKYKNKKVLVEGTVVNVCEKRGCWIEIAGDKPYTKIKVKVEDGEIVFPVSEKGKKALIEGEVYSISLSRSEIIKQMIMESKEHGTKIDSSKAADSTWYQIKGLGAVIK